MNWERVISLQSNDSAALSEMEIDALGEILNISLGSSATSVSQLLSQPVSITTPQVSLVKTKDFDIRLYEPAIGIEVQYTEGLSGSNILIMKRNDIKIIVGLLLQTDFSDKEFVLDEMNIGAICEVMNQMMGAAATALSQLLNRAINISPPSSFNIKDNAQFKEKYLKNDEDIVAVQFDLKIGDLVNSKFINVMRIDLAKELVDNFGVSADEPADTEPQAQVPASPGEDKTPDAQPPENKEPEILQPAAVTSQPPESTEPEAPQMADALANDQPESSQQVPQAPAEVPEERTEPPISQVAAPAQQIHNVANAVYPHFDGANKEKGAKLSEDESKNLDLMMSVPLQVSVEIGRTTKKIKDILDFSSGTIVELNRQAGSQVDVFVNGKAIAKGNVVVVDDNYGVRITEVMNNDFMKQI